jgi:hypothetical protein
MDKGNKKKYGRRKRGFVRRLLGKDLSKASKSSYTRDTSASRRRAWVLFFSVLFYRCVLFGEGREGIVPIHLPSGVLSARTLFFCFITFGGIVDTIYLDAPFATSCPLASYVNIVWPGCQDALSRTVQSCQQTWIKNSNVALPPHKLEVLIKSY